MLGAGLTALLFAAGIATWVFSKLARRTGGGNNQPAFIGAAVVGIIAFIVFYSLLKIFIHS